MKILRMEEKKAFHSNLMKAFVLINRVICVWSLINQGLFSSQLWSTTGNSGDTARLVSTISVDGFEINSKPDPRSSRAVLFIEKTKI